MLYICIAILSGVVPLGFILYDAWLSFEKRLHDLHMKEMMLNHRCNILEEMMKQMEINIMTFSLDLHAHERKTDNGNQTLKNEHDDLHLRVSKIENEMVFIKDKYVQWTIDNRKKLDGW